MLVLTRKEDEAILIGEDIKLKVVSISGDKVRIGIEAPREVRVLREETIEQTITQNKVAASAAIDLSAIAHLKQNIQGVTNDVKVANVSAQDASGSKADGT